MSSTPALPRALRVVAYLEIAFGVWAAIEMLVSLFLSRFVLDLGILGIPIGLGLLRLRRGWYYCCIALLQLTLFGGVLLVILGLSGSTPAYLRAAGAVIAEIPGYWLAIAVTPLLALMLWQYRVLVRPDVRRLFFGDALHQGTAERAGTAHG